MPNVQNVLKMWTEEVWSAILTAAAHSCSWDFCPVCAGQGGGYNHVPHPGEKLQGERINWGDAQVEVVNAVYLKSG